MVDFSPFFFFCFFFFKGKGEGGGGGEREVRSNYYTNRLKLPFSFLRMVDDYPSHGTKF